MANLIATEQVRTGDLVAIDVDEESCEMTFERVDEGLPAYRMFRVAGVEMPDDYEAGRAAASLELLSASMALSPGRD